MKSYSDIEPIRTPVPADRQGAKRHYGVHPYFTRRPANVVRRYIERYSREGDRILDPFGGSGVTAVEAFLSNRVGIQNDINPLANFIAGGVAGLAKGNAASYAAALQSIEESVRRRVESLPQMKDSEVSRLLKTLPLPENVRLPSTSDAETFFELFSQRQLCALALMRRAIDSLEDKPARQGMLLAWSATLAKLNRTFLSAEGRAESRGGSSIFSIYRYKVAKQPVELPPWNTFQERALNVLAAKDEIDKEIKYRKERTGFVGRYEQHSYDVNALPDKIEAVDYVFTDPPYGGHISYIDLSTLWNAWDGRTIGSSVRKKELIVGGEQDLSEESYVEGLSQSIASCFRVLRRNRWLSVVFQHWSTDYFHAILKAAADAGGDLRAAISQIGDPVWSMHKKKGRESVLAGEMILTFFKTGSPKRIRETDSFNVESVVAAKLKRVEGDRLFGEWLFNEVVVEAWGAGALRSIEISKEEFARMIQDHGWAYNETAHCWEKKNARHREGTLF